MSATSQPSVMALPLVVGRTRVYFAPVQRSTGEPTIFDPASSAGWSGGASVAPWVDLGCVSGLSRVSESVLGEVYTSTPSTLRVQTKQKVAASVSFRFAQWSKLSMALASGSQHMNVLVTSGASAQVAGAGGPAVAAVALAANSSSTVLYLATPALALPPVGGLIVVDQDYASQAGFVGSGVSGGYVQTPAAVNSDLDYVRRISFNVQRVISIGSDGGIHLAAPLLAGAPTAGMKLQQFSGFVDREGGSFFQEWSALFVSEGLQGELLFVHYPRLQSSQGSAEHYTPIANVLYNVEPEASFRALPIVDATDGELVVCYRSYVPALNTPA